MHIIGWICIVISVNFFFQLIQPGRDTSMYLFPFAISMIIGIALLGNAKKFEEKQAEKRAASQTPHYAEQYPVLERLLEGFPESYVLLVCVLLFQYLRGLLSGLLTFPLGTIRSISVLAILILPAFKPFPKRNLYLGLAMLGYALNSLVMLLRIPFEFNFAGTIVTHLCSVLVFLAAGVGLISEKHRKLAKRLMTVGESLFFFAFAMALMAGMMDAADDFRELGLTASALFRPGLILAAVGLMYSDYTGPQFPTKLVSRRNALIAVAVVLVVSVTPLRNLLGGVGYSSRPGYSSPSYSYSNSGKTYGAGGYEMPVAGESFSDYVKRVDPDLYRDMEDRYNNLK